MPRIESVLQMGDAFTSIVENWKNRNFQQQQFEQEIGFKNRQLRLNEAFRRDELQETINYHNIVSNRYETLGEQGDARIELMKQGHMDALMSEGFVPIDVTTQDSDVPIYEAYDQSWLYPPEKPIEQARWVTGPYGTKVEQKYTVDAEGNEIIGNYETVISPPIVSGGDGSGTGLSTPYIKQVEMDQAHNIVEQLRRAEYDKDDEEYRYYNAETGEFVEDVPAEEFNELQIRAKENLDSYLDDKARHYNKSFSGFDQIYEMLKEKVDEGFIFEQNLDATVREVLGNVPEDVIKEMEDLLYKRMVK